MANKTLTIPRQFNEVFVEKNFRILFAARFISNVGNGIGPIALAFGVLSLPGANAASLSLVMFARTLPLILFVLFGGVIADRYGRAKIVSYSDILLSLFVLFEAYLFISGSATVSWLVLLGLVTGILHALWFPAFPGIMPQVMPEKKLQSANSINALGVNSANVLGYSLGGILVTLVGPGIAIAIDGLTFLVAGSLIYLLIRFDKPNQVTDEDTVLLDIKLGWKEVRKRTWIIACVSAYSLIVMVYEPLLAVMGPYQAKTLLEGASSWAFIAGAHSLGMMLGVILAMKLRPRHPLFVGMIFSATLALWTLSMSFNLPIIYIALAALLTGISFDLFFVFWITTLQTKIPKKSLSRVLSYDAFGSFLLGPIGLIAAGPLIELIGIKELLAICTVIIIVAVSLSLTNKSVRKLELNK
ncbi:MAG: MFS transporter [Actinomycetes bacterium]